MRTTALMVVISSSRLARLPAEQQQQQQLTLRMGRLEGHHAAPVRVHGGGRISLQSMSDCWITHSTMPCVLSAPVRLAPVPRRPRDVPSQVAITHSERFVMLLSGCYL